MRCQLLWYNCRLFMVIPTKGEFILQSIKLAPSPAQQMSNQQRKDLGIQAFSRQSTVTDIAKQNNTSRQYIHKQKNKIRDAADLAFAETEANDKVLFYLLLDVNYLVRFASTILAGCHCLFSLSHIFSPFFKACFLRKLSP